MGELAKLFGQEVRARRRARGLTQPQLADEVGISEEWLRRIERGEGTPSFDTLEALTAALGVPLADLFANSHPKETARMQALAGLTAGLSESEFEWLEDVVRVVLKRNRRRTKSAT